MASQMIEGPSAIGEPAIWHMIAGVKLQNSRIVCARISSRSKSSLRLELYRLEAPVAVLVQKRPEFVTSDLLCFRQIHNTLIVK